MFDLTKPYKLIGKYCISGTSKKDNKPYIYYKLCLITSVLQTDLDISRQEGIFVNRFDCTSELFNELNIGDEFTEIYYNAQGVVSFVR